MKRKSTMLKDVMLDVETVLREEYGIEPYTNNLDVDLSFIAHKIYWVLGGRMPSTSSYWDTVYLITKNQLRCKGII